jgi:uncharacterized membrane protein
MNGRRRWRFLMNCEEFLGLFREALDGKVPEHIIQDNINYYRSYIQGEVRGGKDEASVISSLGDPRLLAKTVEESTKFAQGGGEGYAEYDGRVYEENGEKSPHIKNIKLPGWFVGILVAMVVLFVIAVVFRVAVFVAPFIIIFLLIGFVYRTIINWINRY